MRQFILTRWRGEALLETVFWRDMLIVGTMLNIASAAAAFAMLAADYSGLLAVAVHILPVPWNIFLFTAVCRSAERDGGPGGLTAKVIGAMWLIAMLFL